MRFKYINILTIICSCVAIVISLFSISLSIKVKELTNNTSNIITIKEKENGETEFTVYDKYGKSIDTYETNKKDK